MTIMEVLFGKKAPELDRLAEQAKKLDEVHGLLEGSAKEIEKIRETLVSRANGSLYPHLVKAGIKAGET